MIMSTSQISMRYPPFDRDRANPENMERVICQIHGNPISKHPIKIGDLSSWHAHWIPSTENENQKQIEMGVIGYPDDRVISKRHGWFIKPDPLHKFSRKVLPYGVFAIFSALIIQAIFGSILPSVPFFGDLLSSPVSIGPLDYPAILFIAFPLFIVPIFLRVASNLRDIRKQRAFSNDPLDDIEMELDWTGDGVTMRILNLPKQFEPTQARLVVGMLVPERDAVLDVIGRDSGGQPPPGLSTPTPVSVIALGESDGTSVGESVPMPSDMAGSLLLEPLRVYHSGTWASLSSTHDSFFLPEPEEKWPGSMYSPLFSVHWEVQMIGKKIHTDSKEAKAGANPSSGEPTDIGWAQVVIVPPRDFPIKIEKMPLSEARDLDPIGGWPISQEIVI